MAPISRCEQFLNLFLAHAEALRCYNCASNLPANTSKDAQQAFKMVLYSTYLVPPVDKLCADPHDVEFQTVPQRNCPPNDQCVKITVQEKNLIFVMRGCQSTIYRDEVTSSNVQCRHDRSPSICRCSNSLCNSVQRIVFGNFVFYLTAFTVTILN